ncbi:MAG: ATP-grasp domain-containing protein [Fimbriiglobus sp.]
MKTVFVYEYFTALGLGRDPSDPAHSFYREGLAMREAVRQDFAAIPGVTVKTLDNLDQDQLADGLMTAAEGVDAAVLISPEFGEQLSRDSRWVDSVTPNRLGPTLEAIRFYSDKFRHSRSLVAAMIRHPITLTQVVGDSDWVVKHRYGAGSFATRWTQSRVERQAILQDGLDGVSPDNLIWQEYVPGRPASVSFLIGSKQALALWPCWQTMSQDRRFTYFGGETIASPELYERAVRLATRAVEALPGLLGYVGVDLILGDDPSGDKDYVLEINPRLTTSYIGLRAKANDNLMSLMWRIAVGEEGVSVRWKPEHVVFHANGIVERISET